MTIPMGMVLDFITYDYDSDEIADLEVSLLEYGLEAPELINPL